MAVEKLLDNFRYTGVLRKYASLAQEENVCYGDQGDGWTKVILSL